MYATARTQVKSTWEDGDQFDFPQCGDITWKCELSRDSKGLESSIANLGALVQARSKDFQGERTHSVQKQLGGAWADTWDQAGCSEDR